MKKQVSKKLWLSSISFLCVGLTFVLACGWTYIEDYATYYSFYTPELSVNKSYSPFFYSSGYYYGIIYDNMQDNRFNDDIVNDWYNYLDKKYSKEELGYILFKTSFADIDSIEKGRQKNASFFPTTVQNMEIVTNIKDKKLNAFYHYIKLAKECETFAVTDFQSDWEYSENKQEKDTLKTIPDICLRIKIDKEYKTCKDPFIKERLWFQLVRAYFFDNDDQKCINTFNTYESNFKKDNMYYRSMSYAAGAYRNRNLSKANYYYSLVFNNCDILKTTAHISFKPQEQSDWNLTLSLCKNKDEQATLWQMLGIFYEDEIKSIEEIIRLNPSDLNKVDILLSRAINKLESGIMSGDTANKESIDNLNNLIDTQLSKTNMKQTYKWQVAKGYVEFLSHHYTNALTHFNLAETVPNISNNEKNQLRLLRFLNTVSSTSFISREQEDKWLPNLIWITNAQKDSSISIRKNYAYQYILKTIAKNYSNQNEILKAELFLSDSKFYENPENIKLMQKFLEKSDKTPFEKYGASIYAYSLDDLYELESIQHALKGNINLALEAMEKSKNGYAELLSNPFNGNIQDCHDCDHMKPQKTKYNKLLFLKKLREINNTLSTDTYNNALLLGNAFYSISYYGSSRYFYESHITGSGDYMTPVLPKSTIADMKQAKKYYEMALNAATNNEQKAKCTYMLAKCERNEYYNTLKDESYGYGNYYYYIAENYFKKIKNYKATKFYNEIIEECGWFKTYVK